MKKIISLVISLVILLSNVFSVNSYARNNIYSEQGKYFVEYLRTDYPSILQKSSNYEYVQFVNNIHSSWVSMSLLQAADFFAQTGVKPDEEKYREVLLNIIAAYDFSSFGNMADQKKLDNLKTFKDYGKDTVKIASQAVSVISGVSPAAGKLEENIASAIEGLSVLMDTTQNWIDAFSDLETVVQSYSNYSEFLKLIKDNSKGELRKAAISLKRALDSSVKIRLETYKDVTDENFKRWGESYFSSILFESCKATKQYETDDTLKWFVDSGEDIAGKLGALTSSWELGAMVGILVGNLAVGGENLADRLMETMAVKDIGEILSNELQNMMTKEFQEVVGTKEEILFVEKYVELSRFLIGCRVRGEYCWYSIIANDAGLLSSFNKKTGKAAETVYNNRVKSIERIEKELEALITVSKNPYQEEDIIGSENKVQREEKTNQNNFRITEKEAIKLAREKMGDDFGYVYSQMTEYEGINYFVILVKGKVDTVDAPTTTLTKIFVSENGKYVKEGSDYSNDGKVIIDFFE